MIDRPAQPDASNPIRLRAHTLLCLQGFRGMGYSPGFVDNMAAIHRVLTVHPQSVVEILDGPDAVCGACPHRRLTGCTLNGDRTEQEMKDQDHAVLRKLGLRVGSRIPWSEVLDCIRVSVHAADLHSICGQCRWLPLGFCREGIDRLQHPVANPPSNQR